MAKEVAKDGQIIEVPHIDCIFRDQPLKLEDHVQMDQIQDLKHQLVQVHIQSEYGQQNTQCLNSPWNNRLSESSKSCEEYGDQEKKLRTHSLGFQSWRTFTELEVEFSSRQGELMQDRPIVPHGLTYQWA